MAGTTRVDDILIEMISPKLKEIEERFSKGEGLTNEDLNTLLLKSQYNHINHLDEKLDEVTNDVSKLRSEFHGLRSEFHGLRSEFHGLRSEFHGLRSEFGTLKSEIALEIQTAINTNMKWSIGMIALIVTVLKLADMVFK